MTANEMFSSQKMQEDEARAKAIEAADIMVKHCGGFWHWIDDRQIRVYYQSGQAFGTVHVEQVQ